MNSVLIRATNWIGDSIMSLPALKELRRLYPQTRLTVLAKPWVSDIYATKGLADEVVLFERNAYTDVRAIVQLSRRLRQYNFDCALLFQNAFEAAVIARLAGIPVRIGYDTDHRGFLLTRPIPVQRKVLAMHQSFYYLNLLTESQLSPVQYVREAHYQPDARLQLSDRKSVV